MFYGCRADKENGCRKCFQVSNHCCRDDGHEHKVDSSLLVTAKSLLAQHKQSTAIVVKNDWNTHRCWISKSFMTTSRRIFCTPLYNAAIHATCCSRWTSSCCCSVRQRPGTSMPRSKLWRSHSLSSFLSTRLWRRTESWNRFHWLLVLSHRHRKDYKRVLCAVCHHASPSRSSAARLRFPLWAGCLAEHPSSWSALCNARTHLPSALTVFCHKTMPFCPPTSSPTSSKCWKRSPTTCWQHLQYMKRNWINLWWQPS